MLCLKIYLGSKANIKCCQLFCCICYRIICLHTTVLQSSLPDCSLHHKNSTKKIVLIFGIGPTTFLCTSPHEHATVIARHSSQQGCLLWSRLSRLDIVDRDIRPCISSFLPVFYNLLRLFP